MRLRGATRSGGRSGSDGTGWAKEEGVGGLVGIRRRVKEMRESIWGGKGGRNLIGRCRIRTR